MYIDKLLIATVLVILIKDTCFALPVIGDSNGHKFQRDGVELSRRIGRKLLKYRPMDGKCRNVVIYKNICINYRNKRVCIAKRDKIVIQC